MLQSRHLDRGDVNELLLTPGELPAHLASMRSPIWLDYQFPDPNPQELEQIAAALELHPLALEQLIDIPHRAKLTRFPDQLVITAFALNHAHGPKHEQLHAHPISIVLTPTAVLTVRRNEHLDVAAVLERWHEHQDAGDTSPLTPAWALLDTLVDTHLDQVQRLDGALEHLEARLFGDNPDTAAIQHSAYMLHKQAFVLRRTAAPMREILSDLNVIVTTDPKTARLIPFLSNVTDHAHRVEEWTGTLREMADTLIDTNQAVRSNQMNLAMKKVSSWAAIIAVPTMISGIYGMNEPLPFQGHPAVFWVTLGIMAASSAVLYWRFKRVGWL